MAEPGYVYFVQPSRGGPIKVGWSENPWGRLSDLQQGCWEELRIIATLRLLPDQDGYGVGAGSFERAIHERFRKHRLQREWFSFDGEFKDFIDALLGGEAISIGRFTIHEAA